MTLDEWYAEEYKHGPDAKFVRALIEVAKAAKTLREAERKEYSKFQTAITRIDDALAALDKELEG